MKVSSFPVEINDLTPGASSKLFSPKPRRSLARLRLSWLFQEKYSGKHTALTIQHKLVYKFSAVAEDLKRRFPAETVQLFGLSALMPSTNVLKVDPLDREMATHFESFGSRSSSILSMRLDIMKSLIQAEVCLSKKKWKRVAEADDEKMYS
ncbi:hypothetical protein JTB14_033867 [Gonioctena quinquepunctata]|nr:hypothetical protein JTB14_033867 [Gonioctena quinquepunctata]